MAGPAYPTWLYNQVATNQQPPQIVQNAAQQAALGPAWATTPFPPGGTVPAPFDPGFPNTDARLQQQLIEARITNILLQQGLNIQTDVDATGLRAEIAALDSSITS